MVKHVLLTVPAALLWLSIPALSFEVSSPDIPAGKTIARQFVFTDCTGNNVSPAMRWKNALAGSKSFALTVHDPDAPTPRGFWHWLVIDLPASTQAVAQGAGTADGNALPAGARQITNDFGAPGWGGPCPPAGDQPHRYNFTVYALKVAKLPLPADASAAAAAAVINTNALDKAGFTALYGR